MTATKVKMLAVSFVIILTFTTLGIWITDAFFFRLGDFLTILVMVIPWVLFMVLLLALLCIRMLDTFHLH